MESVTAAESMIAEPKISCSALRYRGVNINDLVGQVPFGHVWGLLVDNEFNPGLPPADPFPLPVHTGHARVDVQSALRSSLRSGASGQCSTSTPNRFARTSHGPR